LVFVWKRLGENRQTASGPFAETETKNPRPAAGSIFAHTGQELCENWLRELLQGFLDLWFWGYCLAPQCSRLEKGYGGSYRKGPCDCPTRNGDQIFRGSVYDPDLLGMVLARSSCVQSAGHRWRIEHAGRSLESYQRLVASPSSGAAPCGICSWCIGWMGNSRRKPTA
jgi:hypothetical protein